MIYYTGDIHGDVERVAADVRRYGIGAEDTVVLLGDVGVNFFGDRQDAERKRVLNSLGPAFLSIHGNHEMRPETVSSYHETVWHGGTVYAEDAYPRLLFAKDGEFYDLDGYTAIVIGGAYSVDKFYRQARGLPWFPDEQPSEETKRQVEENLAAHGWIVDVVLSHTCPERYIPTEAFLPGLDQSMIDRSTEEWLGKLEDKLCYGYWLCGHWHIDKRIDKMHFLMRSYETLPELREYSFNVDETGLQEMLAWCQENGTTLDLVTRAFFRFAADPNNRGILERWVEAYKRREINQILSDKDTFLHTLQENLAKAVLAADTLSPTGIQARLEALQEELIARADSRENYDAIADEILRLRAQQEQSVADSHSQEEALKRIEELQEFIRGQSAAVTEFDEALAMRLVQGITVYPDHFTVVFQSGVSVEIEEQRIDNKMSRSP